MTVIIGVPNYEHFRLTAT